MPLKLSRRTHCSRKNMSQMTKRILFLSGTRADFGKLKSLINKVEADESFDVHIFVTGMHLLARYGMTANEIEKCGYKNMFRFINQNQHDSMDTVLAKTIMGLSDYVKEFRPDMLIVHGDRVEALAGAIVGSLNNILVGHIEGGEVSGTVDELIRHSVSKLSHIHFVSHETAKNRLIQLGEKEDSIFVIGSPDIDIMSSGSLPSILETKQRYEIYFSNYALFMYHPVTTERDSISSNIKEVIRALKKSDLNYIVIYPNNDDGSEFIMEAIGGLVDDDHFRIFPSVRFECFLSLLKHADFIIGNSSAGVREAPFYGVPSINIGSRQHRRATANTIVHCKENVDDILEAIKKATSIKTESMHEFGTGQSDVAFHDILNTETIWKVSNQKSFVDLPQQIK